MSSFTPLSLAENFALPRSFLILGLTAVITACGGGGGGGGDKKAPAPPISVPVAAAYNKMIIDGLQASTKLSGKINGDNVGGSATYRITPAVAATFQGQAGLSGTQTVGLNLVVDGDTLPPAALVNTVYYDSNYQEIGSFFNGGPAVGMSYSTVSQSNPLPANASAKDAGDLTTTISHTDVGMKIVNGSTSSTWRVEADSATSLILRISIKFFDIGHNLSETDDYLYRIDTAGNISLAGIEIDGTDGTKITFKPQ